MNQFEIPPHTHTTSSQPNVVYGSTKHNRFGIDRRRAVVYSYTVADEWCGCDGVVVTSSVQKTNGLRVRMRVVVVANAAITFFQLYKAALL